MTEGAHGNEGGARRHYGDVSLDVHALSLIMLLSSLVQEVGRHDYDAMEFFDVLMAGGG